MPRINLVERARRSPGTCGRCQKRIEVGSPYKWIKFRYGGKRFRCGNCNFRGSELTSSDKIASARGAGEALEDAVSAWDGDDVAEIREAIDEAVEAIQEVIDEYQEAIDALPEAFQDSSPTAERCQEAIDELEGWKSDLESISIDDFDADADADADEEAQRESWADEIRSEVGDATSCPL